jgi:hypothetical protein
VEDRENLDRRLRAANRVPRGTEGTPDSDALLDRIGVRITAEPLAEETPIRRTGRARLRMPSPRRGVLLASVAGLVVVGGAAAATTILSTYTGQYPTSQQQVQEFGSGQFLRIGAAGFCQAADQLAANIPFPDGDRQAWVDWSLLVDVGTKSQITIRQLCDTSGSLSHNADDGTGADETTSSVQGMLAQSAFCAWTDTWLKANASGDTTTQSSAASELAGALQWPASQAYDPHPVARYMNGNVVEGSLLGWFIPVQKAVQAGDFTSVKSLWSDQASTDYAGTCMQYRPVAASENGTVLTPAMLSPTAQSNGI